MHGWEWDTSSYGGSAPFYRQGRLPYSPDLADAFRDALSLDGKGRLIDIGTGPGIIALALAPLFEEVIGIDADAEMVAEAAKEAERKKVSNARWVHVRAEELPAGLGSFRVATFAQSFHWTQREEVARIVGSMLEPQHGRLVLVTGYTRSGVDPVRPLEHPSPPSEAIGELVRRYLGSVRRAGQGLLPDGTPFDEEEVLGLGQVSRVLTSSVSRTTG